MEGAKLKGEAIEEERTKRVNKSKSILGRTALTYNLEGSNL